MTPRNNLYVEYLIVIDNSVYNRFYYAFGGNLPENLLTDYIRIFFSQLVNSVNTFIIFRNLFIS